MNAAAGKGKGGGRSRSIRLGICILAGGQSSRMRREKAKLRLRGQPLLARIRRQVEASGWRVRVIRRDLVPGLGPLGGVYTALTSSDVDAELFLACDMPFVSLGLLRGLVRALGSRRLAVFARANGRSGFPFVVRVSALPLVEQQMTVGRRSLQALAQRLNSRLWPVPRGRARELFNINTPAAWKQAVALVASDRLSRRWSVGNRAPD